MGEVSEAAGDRPPTADEDFVRIPADDQGAPAEVLDTWDCWWCPACGRRYGQPFRAHGAPERCRVRLVAATVTITRRTS